MTWNPLQGPHPRSDDHDRADPDQPDPMTAAIDRYQDSRQPTAAQLAQHARMVAELREGVRDTPKRAGEAIAAGQYLTLFDPADGRTIHGFMPANDLPGVYGELLWGWREGMPATMNVGVALRDFAANEAITGEGVRWV